jgi:hypothetical protein
MSRAGKRIIGKYISKDAGSPPIVKGITSLHSTWQDRNKTPKSIGFLLAEEKPQPYVPLTSGKIEDPIVLPSFDEFLQAKGAEFMVRKGKDELFYRIEKATDQLSKLRDTLNQKLALWNSPDDKRSRNRKSTHGRINLPTYRSQNNSIDNKKQRDLRSLINQYYEMPKYYSSPGDTSQSIHLSPLGNLSLSSEAEGGLEESLRNFYRSKAIENKKLSDILDKILVDRPYSIKEKLFLIQDDKQKYKNKHHSIEKFNEFRETIEHKKREKQYKSFQQAIAYLEILDEFKRKKHEPCDSELLLLELWKRMIEGGWVVTKEELAEMSSVLSYEENSFEPVRELIEKFEMNC